MSGFSNHFGTPILPQRDSKATRRARERAQRDRETQARTRSEDILRLARDFSDHPEQVGLYLEELVGRGEMSAASLEETLERLSRVMGEAFTEQVVDRHGMRRGIELRRVAESLGAQLGLSNTEISVRVDEEAAARTSASGSRGVMEDGVVYLNPAAAASDSQEGRTVLAHELVHVAQRARGAGVSSAEGGAAAEREASQIAEQAGTGGVIRPPAQSLAFDARAADNGPTQTKPDSRPTLIYYVVDKRVVVAIKPPSDDQASIQAAFDAAGAKECFANWQTVTPSDPTWPLFYALHQDNVLGPSAVRWAALAKTIGALVTEGDKQAKVPGAPKTSLGSVAPVGAGMVPGPWSPPGKQPIPFYIGNEAHAAITAEYRASHVGDVVFANYMSISSIVSALAETIPGLNVDALGSSGALKPDILNATLHHLYEIKPESLTAQGLAEANMYVAALASAGLVVALGPPKEPGTQGVLPAPGGYFRFWSPMPGVIVYKYSKKKPEGEPIPVPAPQPETEEEPGFDMDRVFEWGYWEEVTGLTGAALVGYLIVSELSRLYPPRNAVPVP